MYYQMSWLNSKLVKGCSFLNCGGSAIWFTCSASTFVSFYKTAKWWRGKEGEAVLLQQGACGNNIKLRFAFVAFIIVTVWIQPGQKRAFWSRKGLAAYFQSNDYWFIPSSLTWVCLMLVRVKLNFSVTRNKGEALSCKRKARSSDEFYFAIPTATWDSKDDLWFSCASCSVDVSANSSEMKRFLFCYSNFYLSRTVLFHNVSACAMMLGWCVCVTIVNGKTTLAGFEEQYVLGLVKPCSGRPPCGHAKKTTPTWQAPRSSFMAKY